jgi:hypothetical protein
VTFGVLIKEDLDVLDNFRGVLKEEFHCTHIPNFGNNYNKLSFLALEL